MLLLKARTDAAAGATTNSLTSCNNYKQQQQQQILLQPATATTTDAYYEQRQPSGKDELQIASTLQLMPADGHSKVAQASKNGLLIASSASASTSMLNVHSFNDQATNEDAAPTSHAVAIAISAEPNQLTSLHSTATSSHVINLHNNSNNSGAGGRGNNIDDYQGQTSTESNAKHQIVAAKSVAHNNQQNQRSKTQCVISESTLPNEIATITTSNILQSVHTNNDLLGPPTSNHNLDFLQIQSAQCDNSAISKQHSTTTSRNLNNNHNNNNFKLIAEQTRSHLGSCISPNITSQYNNNNNDTNCNFDHRSYAFYGVASSSASASAAGPVTNCPYGNNNNIGNHEISSSLQQNQTMQYITTTTTTTQYNEANNYTPSLHRDQAAIDDNNNQYFTQTSPNDMIISSLAASNNDNNYQTNIQQQHHLTADLHHQQHTNANANWW